VLQEQVNHLKKQVFFVILELKKVSGHMLRCHLILNITPMRMHTILNCNTKDITINLLL